MTLFDNREQAGRLLALKLEKFREQEPVVLALPRGGVPVGREIAGSLDAPLDIIFVRKIGAPGAPELAAGAIVEGQEPELVLNEEIIKLYGVTPRYLEERKKQQLAEIERRRKLYRPGHAPVSVEGRTVIIVDDGIATGATIRAAVQALKHRKPQRIVIAVPVAPAEAVKSLLREADEVICLETPFPFYAIGSFYKNFDQLSDETVIRILQEHDRDADETERTATS